MTPERQLDPEALGDHIDRLYRAAWGSVRSREEAEDLVQETFARVLRKPRFLRSEDDLGYLLRVLRNTFFSRRRTAAPPTADDAAARRPRPDRGPLARRGPSRALESAELYAAIAAAARRLPRRAGRDRRRRALLPRGGQALRVREATITTRLHRARQRVARDLVSEPTGPSTPPASVGQRP